MFVIAVPGLQHDPFVTLFHDFFQEVLSCPRRNELKRVVLKKRNLVIASYVFVESFQDCGAFRERRSVHPDIEDPKLEDSEVHIAQASQLGHFAGSLLLGQGRDFSCANVFATDKEDVQLQRIRISLPWNKR